MHNRIEILDIPLSNITKKELLEEVQIHFSEQKGNLFIITANPEIIMTAKSSPLYRETLLGADYIVPDGIGVMIASKLLNQPLQEKLPGYELMHDFLAYAQTHKKCIYFYGAKPGYAQQCAENAKKTYSGLQVAGYMDGYTKDRQTAAKEIATTMPDFVFVAMGAPLQELWIAEFKHLFPNSVLIGVGGSFDVLSGNVKRAPQFWVKNNLEWLYRLITQPSRAKRMLKIPLFLIMVIKEKFIR
jgi:N-acetylglucosaminyldiphosphoundecaprenol N-acetyl-beta-D-mannosaminyltransferase